MAKGIPTDQTIGTLAATHAGFRAVFEDLGLDDYCSGHLTLDDGARGAGLDPDDVHSAMQRVMHDDPGPQWIDRLVHELIDYLDREHHQLLRSSVFQTAVLLDDALSRHGDACAGSLRHIFRLFSEELLEHIEREEIALFPLAAALDDAWSKGEAITADAHDIRTTLLQLTLQHGAIVQKLDAVSTELKALDGMQDPTCRKIVNNIRAIARQVHSYFNLESQIVFPHVLAFLEQQVPA